jgi:hypothetical protein
MRIVGVVLGVITVVALDLILLIGAGGEPPPWFGALVLVMDLSLIASSVALGVTFLRSGRRLLGLLFLANLVVMLVALILRVSGVQFPRTVLFGADLYWLNLYLVGLAILIRERRVSLPNQLPQPAGPASREVGESGSSSRPGS